MKQSTKGGFTLIEMLVVVLIIVLLAGLVFRMVGAIGKGNDIAATRATIEKVSHALEEFKAIYGKYPPVPFYQGKQQIGYEYPTLHGWGDNAEAKAKNITDNGRGKLSEWGGSCTIYTFGLASFFMPRYNGTAERGPQAFCGVNSSYHTQSGGVMQWTQFNSRVNGKLGDSDRDLNAVRRILPFLGGKLGPDNRIADPGCIVTWESPRPDPLDSSGEGLVTNLCAQFIDAWRRPMNYSSMPPYETYKLWSNGPDGIEGTSDDIVSGTN
jgi:prepilin-type N-terminal cleavage/methylation domain-containing protein